MLGKHCWNGSHLVQSHCGTSQHISLKTFCHKQWHMYPSPTQILLFIFGYTIVTWSMDCFFFHSFFLGQIIIRYGQNIYFFFFCLWPKSFFNVHILYTLIWSVLFSIWFSNCSIVIFLKGNSYGWITFFFSSTFFFHLY